MTIAYKGDDYHGFATNPGVETVASVIEGALAQILQEPIKITPAGRTDAGVHAWGQVIGFDLPDRVNLEVLAKQLNALCGPSIAVREYAWTTPDFHARYSAMWRAYRYTVLNSPVPNPFLVNTAWQITTPLKIKAMQLASDAIIGEHDFSAFCRKPKPALGWRLFNLTTVRRQIPQRCHFSNGTTFLRKWLACRKSLDLALLPSIR